MNYWSFGDYLGIGPGAHSKISFPHSITRMARTRNPQVWMQQALQGQGKQVSERYEVKATELPFEFMLNVLRLKDGVPYEHFTPRGGGGGQRISKAINVAAATGWLE